MAHGSDHDQSGLFPLVPHWCSKRHKQAAAELYFPLRSADWTREWEFFCLMAPYPWIELQTLYGCLYHERSKSPRAAYRFLWPRPISAEWQESPSSTNCSVKSSYTSFPTPPPSLPVFSPPNLSDANLPSRTALSWRLTRQSLQEWDLPDFSAALGGLG